jgi:hypothetical protein
MGRTRLEKPKPITLYSIGEEPYRKKTHKKTKIRWEDVVKKDVEELGGKSD